VAGCVVIGICTYAGASYILKSPELDVVLTGIRKGMAHNTGQCIPVNIIAQDFIDYVERHDLDPSKTLLWISDSRLNCNFRLYPEFLKTLLDNYGKGFGKAEVYLGDIANLDISLNASIRTYFVYMLGGLVRKLGCHIRPYETVPGTTEQVMESSMDILEEAFSGTRNMESAVSTMAQRFNGIDTRKNGSRPKVAIFGDFFVRDHDRQAILVIGQNAGDEKPSFHKARFKARILDSIPQDFLDPYR